MLTYRLSAQVPEFCLYYCSKNYAICEINLSSVGNDNDCKDEDSFPDCDEYVNGLGTQNWVMTEVWKNNPE